MEALAPLFVPHWCIDRDTVGTDEDDEDEEMLPPAAGGFGELEPSAATPGIARHSMGSMPQMRAADTPASGAVDPDADFGNEAEDFEYEDIHMDMAGPDENDRVMETEEDVGGLPRASVRR